MLLNSLLLQITSRLDLSKTDSLLNSLLDKLIALGGRIIAAVIIYFIGRWVVSFLRKLIGKILKKREIDPAVASFVNSVVGTLLNIILAIIIIGALGIETASLAAILAAAGFAVGMAMKDNLSNFAAGVLLLVNKPFKVDDRIVAQGMDGNVKAIGILYTILQTADGRTIYMPNGPLATGSIINYSTLEDRRVDITFNVNYGNDADSLKNIMMDIISSNKLIKQDPAPFVGVTAVNNGNFDITIRVWAANGDYGKVNIDLNESVYRTLRDKGIFTSSPLSVKMLKE